MANVEGAYRSMQSVIITHSEEIAFYNGNKWEKDRLSQGFNQIR